MLNRLANESCVSRLNLSIRTKRKEAAKCKRYQRFYQKDGFYKIDLEEKQHLFNTSWYLLVHLDRGKRRRSRDGSCSTQEGWMIRARAERRAETASSSKLILDHGWPRLRDEKTRDIGRRIGRDGSRDRR